MALTRRQALQWAAGRLEGSARRIEAEQLLGSVLQCSRANLYLDLSAALTSEQETSLRRMVAARGQGEPLQYVTGVQSFGPLDLVVGPGVLVPRPETELVAQRCVQLLEGIEAPVVVDIGTGTGAIALFIAAQRPDAELWAIDVSSAALAWARRNLAALGLAGVRLLQSDLFEALPGRLHRACDLVVSNPPYLSQKEFEAAPVEVREHEPESALMGGRSGAELSEELISQAPTWLRSGGKLVIETGPGQAKRVQRAMEQHFQGVTISSDLSGRPRIAEGSKP